MDIKYTIEILTKDIQDIENLVGKLQNSPEGSTLELDLALSKLRNVYDVLNSIRNDMLNPPAGRQEQGPGAEAAASVQPVTEEQALPGPRAPETAEAGLPVQAATPSAPENHPGATPSTAEAQAGAAPSAPENHRGAAPSTAETQGGVTPSTAKTQDGAVPSTAEAPAARPPEAEPAGTERPIRPESRPGESKILADTFRGESSLNDNLAEQSTPQSRVLGERIDNIGRNIGINDRFLIIRELFKGDADAFNRLIEQLDNAGSYEAASRLLNAQFAETPDHEGVLILGGLTKRRYS